MRGNFAIFACLAATGSALNFSPASNTKTPSSSVQRSRRPVAQNGWITAVDEETGQPYYYNEQTGHSQWEPPLDQQAFGAQAVWHLQPTNGVQSQYTLSNGQQLVLGRFDMINQASYVSEEQALVRIADDGTATLVSLGDRTTMMRPRPAAPWLGLRRDAATQLRDGAQIGLDRDYAEGAVFTIFRDGGAEW